MRTALRIAALLLIAGTLGWWIQAGKNPGWTKNRVAVEQVDEFTGITFTEYQERFVPGVEILAGGLIGGFVLGGITLIRRRARVV